MERSRSDGAVSGRSRTTRPSAEAATSRIQSIWAAELGDLRAGRSDAFYVRTKVTTSDSAAAWSHPCDIVSETLPNQALQAPPAVSLMYRMRIFPCLIEPPGGTRRPVGAPERR
jgi:hypothetical protein